MTGQSPENLRAAVRRALARANGPDMRSVGQEAASLLSQELVYQAATAYLTQLARQEHNRVHAVEVPDGGTFATDQTVVHVAGRDLFLGDTTPDDRDWAAKRRESLGDGLLRRASQLRSLGTRRALTAGEVRHAEQDNVHLAALVQALEAAAGMVASGELAQAVEARCQAATQHRRAAIIRAGVYRRLIPDVDDLVDFPRARRVARRGER